MNTTLLRSAAYKNHNSNEENRHHHHHHLHAMHISIPNLHNGQPRSAPAAWPYSFSGHRATTVVARGGRNERNETMAGHMGVINVGFMIFLLIFS